MRDNIWPEELHAVPPAPHFDSSRAHATRGAIRTEHANCFLVLPGRHECINTINLRRMNLALGTCAFGLATCGFEGCCNREAGTRRRRNAQAAALDGPYRVYAPPAQVSQRCRTGVPVVRCAIMCLVVQSWTSVHQLLDGPQ